MLNQLQKRRLSWFLKHAEPAVDLLCLLIMTAFFLRMLPSEIFSSQPATGGDTGSHFWTLYGLYEHALPNWGVRYWNPGNHAGEPRLIHYFPLPFLVMAALAKAIPLGMAFNIGTVLGTFFFPYCAYLALRGVGLRFPAPIFGTAAAFFAHYNESFSMWGGNTLSTLAGQFAHSYALNLLLLGIGALGWEIRRRRVPLLSPLLFAGVFLSHGYPALGIPFVLLAFLLLYEHGSLQRRLVVCTLSGGFAFLLAVWFVVPMQLNGPWQTRHDLVWTSQNLLREVCPPVFYPLLIGFLLVLLVGVFCLFVRNLVPAKVRVVASFTLPVVLTVVYARLVSIYLSVEASASGTDVSQLPGALPRSALLFAGVLSLLGVAAIGVRIFKTKRSPAREQVLSKRALFLILGGLALLFLGAMVATILGVVPPFYYALVGVAFLTGVLFSVRVFQSVLPLSLRTLFSGWGVWLVLIGWFAALYYLLPLVHLIDIRAVPQVQLFGCLFLGAFFGGLLSRINRPGALLLTLPFVLISLLGADLQVKNFPNWLKWNLSGWEPKALYSQVLAISDGVRGDFSQPRIIYELSDKAQATGTIRVWEMLPYFAGRATLESVYLEATLLSGEAVWLQAEISKFPSCPLPQYPCTRFNIPGAERRMELMGVGGVILATDETKAQARAADFLFEHKSSGPWTVFLLKRPPALVDVFRERPKLFDAAEDWRRPFYEWFRAYSGVEPFLIAPERLSQNLRHSLEAGDPLWQGDSTCAPTVEVDFNRIILRTQCPNKAHYLKFNYHPAWRANTGDELFIVSPAFMGIVPSANEVVLEFGSSPVWKVSNTVSVLSLLALLALPVAPVVRRVCREDTGVGDLLSALTKRGA